MRATLRSTELQEDIRQETLLRVLRRVRSGEPLEHPDRLGAFVHGVCTNVTREMQRKRDRHPQLHEDAPEPADPCPDQEEEMASSERAELVREVISTLAPKDRMVLSLVYLDEVEREEACRRLKIGANNLRVVLHRARLQFKKALERREK